MITHNLKISIRQIRKNKFFNLINISGLVIGMVSFLLIYQYVSGELNFDSFHKNKKNLFRICNNNYSGNVADDKSAACNPALAPALFENFSEIENYTRLLRGIRMVVSNEALQTSFRSDDIYFADSSFMSMFSFPVASGQSQHALDLPNTAVITSSFAEKTFGSVNPIGQSLHFKSRYFDFQCLVSVVLEDIPENSHLKFDALVSMPTYITQYPTYGNLNGWLNPMYFTYLQLKPGTDPLALEAKFSAFIERIKENPADGEHTKYTLDNIGNIHLNDEKIQQYLEPTISKKTLNLLLAISILILIIAWVNFINLSTAKALDRAKEVGVRKVSGALKRNLIGQFYLESFLINGMALLFALTIYFSLGNVADNVLGKHLDLNIFGNLKGIFLVIFLFVGGIFISGTYPAFVLSSYKPEKVLKGKPSGNTRSFDFRKALVVFQFAASLFLIAGAMAIYTQVNYLRSIDLGMNANQLLVVRAPLVSSDSLFMVKINQLKEEIKHHPNLKSMAGSYYIPGNEIRWKINLGKMKDDNEPITFCLMQGDVDLVTSFGFRLLCGRTFNEISDADNQCIILNEIGVKALGYSTPESILNHTLYENKKAKKVIGVIADYQQESAKLEVEPICIYSCQSKMNYYSLNIQNSDISKTVALVQGLWKDKFPGDPFDFFFLDEYMDRQYKADIQFGKVFSFFTYIALFIACLGLFGLSYHTTRLRTKEIGIRKTLGASARVIMTLLLKDTLSLIIISTFVALPLAGYFISKWLDNYAFKIEISWWFFVLPVFSLIIIAFGTVGFHVTKTANANPVESIKYE